MKNTDCAGGFLCTDEERLLISRATELSVRGENSAVALSFLTPREQRLVFEAMDRMGRSNHLFMWGGYVGATRRRAIFLPSWLDLDTHCPFSLFSEEREKYYLEKLREYGMESVAFEAVFAVLLKGSGYATLTHRDYLGALIALGLKRNVLGDICVSENSAVAFGEENACNYIIHELKKAGRDTLRCEKIDVGGDFVCDRRFEDIAVTVASLRLDGVVRALCNVSREEAADLVSQGLVEVNYFVQKENDRSVSSGDIISVRGYGKYIIDSAGGLTRRQRIRVSARKYV